MKPLNSSHILDLVKLSIIKRDVLFHLVLLFGCQVIHRLGISFRLTNLISVYFSESDEPLRVSTEYGEGNMFNKIVLGV